MELKNKIFFLLKSGLTEEAIARAVNVNQSTISRILSGKIHDPRNSLVIAISRLFEREKLKTFVDAP